VPSASNTKSPGGAAAPPSRGSRQIFPLPAVDRERFSEEMAEYMCEAVSALNFLAGFTEADVPPAEAAEEVHAEVLARVEGLVQRAQRARAGAPSPQEAFRDLMRGRAGYDLDLTGVTLAPFHTDHVSLPEDLSGSPYITDLLGEGDRQLLEVAAEPLLRSADDAEEHLKYAPDRPYQDPVLSRQRRHYVRFIRRLDRLGMLRWRRDRIESIGLFFVYKKDKVQRRMILDARRSNCHFGTPPGVDLLTSEGLGDIEIDTTCTTEHNENFFELTVSTADIDNCFHRYIMPEWMSAYFAYPPLTGKEANKTGSKIDGQPVLHNEMLYPCARPLPMGFTWSLYLAQRAGERQGTLCPRLASSTLFNDRQRPLLIRLRPDTYDQLWHFVYVDNFGVIGRSHEGVRQALEGLCDVMSSQGLVMHEKELSSNSVEVLGVTLDCASRCTRASGKRFWRVRGALRYLLWKGRCTGSCLEVIVGHCTFLGLIRREILSVFHTVYAFMEANYNIVSQLWVSVREELAAFLGLTFFLESGWERHWNSAAMASDASLTGWGLARSWWHPCQVAEVGRVRERDRFRRT